MEPASITTKSTAKVAQLQVPKWREDNQRPRKANIVTHLHSD